MHTSYVYRSTNFYICLPLCNPKQKIRINAFLGPQTSTPCPFPGNTPKISTILTFITID